MTARALRFTCSALVLGMALVAPRAVRADAAAQARFHDELARKAYDRMHYGDALREFFLEQRLAPNPRTAFNIALCFEQLKRDEDAYLYFGEYLSGTDTDKERRDYAEASVKKLEPKVARVEVASTPPGASIYVDEKEHGEYGKAPRTLAIAPGKHRVWVELPGYRKAEVELTAKKGEVAKAALAPERIVGKLAVAANVGGTAEVTTPEGLLAAQGPTPLAADLPPGPYQIVVHAPGYAPARGVASVREAAKVDYAAALERLPEPGGDVTITANVSGALIELDGQAAGFTPSVLANVPRGAHQLRVSGAGRVPWVGPVPVVADERAWVTVSLEDPPQRTRSPLTWATGGIGVAMLGAGAVTGVLAIQNHQRYDSAAPGTDLTGDISRGNSLNTATTVLLVGGAIATAAAVVLYFGTAETTGHASSASVARGEK